MYTFNKDTYIQEEGGSIGERITQALVSVVMLDWDQKFLFFGACRNEQDQHGAIQQIC